MAIVIIRGATLREAYAFDTDTGKKVAKQRKVGWGSHPQHGQWAVITFTDGSTQRVENVEILNEEPAKS